MNLTNFAIGYGDRRLILKTLPMKEDMINSLFLAFNSDSFSGPSFFSDIHLSQTPLNALDSTAPLVKRGKERESPSRKKPSRVKRVCIKGKLLCK